MATCQQTYGSRLVAVIRRGDVDRKVIKRGKRRINLDDTLGYVQKGDVGKCLVRSGDILQVENEDQRHLRKMKHVRR